MAADRGRNNVISFRSTNSNAQDFIPHLRYMPTSSSRSRTATAKKVRARRDTWLAAALNEVRESTPVDAVETGRKAGPEKSVARMLLEDNQEGLTKRKFTLESRISSP